MTRNLDLTALRSFATVAEAGGVTRAAGILNLTQSAVSMQLKRLEESLDVSLIDRSGRTVGLTTAGEQLLGYARRMLELNDEIYGKLTATQYEGELKLGVPHDIIYPRVPAILKQFAQAFPRMRVHLVSAPTRKLQRMFGRGEVDVILTTEDAPGPGGEALIRLPLVWVGAKGGQVWKERPLRVAFCTNCAFRPGVLRALEDSDIPFEMVVDSEMDNAVEAAISADLAIHAAILGYAVPNTEPVPLQDNLPPLGDTQIILYAQQPDAPVTAALCEIIRNAHRVAPALREAG